MTLQEFIQSLDYDTMPESLTVPLQALWWDAKGDWARAHALINDLEDSVSAHVHAYLHRKEGDLWNARYWYSRAQQPEFKGPLQEEWRYLLDLYSR